MEREWPPERVNASSLTIPAFFPPTGRTSHLLRVVIHQTNIVSVLCTSEKEGTLKRMRTEGENVEHSFLLLHCFACKLVTRRRRRVFISVALGSLKCRSTERVEASAFVH